MPECQTYYFNAALFDSFCKQDVIDGKEIDIKVNGIPLTVKVASRPETQAEGYSAHSEPNDGEGMLFVYPTEAQLAFWMKGVDFDLDIIFFDKDKNSVGLPYLMQAENGEDNQLKRYVSKGPALYALELPALWCKKHGSPDGKYKLELQ